MNAPAWTLWIQRDDVSIAMLEPGLTALHDAGASLEFHRRAGVTVVRAVGDAWHESSAAAATLARTLQCPVFHLWGSFGTCDELSAEGFTERGTESWSLSSPDEPTGEWSFERAYWRMHRALRLPGKASFVNFFVEAPLEVTGRGWKTLGFWPTEDEASADAQARARTVDAAARLKTMLARLAKKTGATPAAVRIDLVHRRLSAATETSVAALERKLRPRSVLLRRYPASRAKVWSQAAAFPVSLRLSADDTEELARALSLNPRMAVRAVHSTLGKHVLVSSETERGLTWWTKVPQPEGAPLLSLTPKELVQAIAEGPICLDAREWPRLSKHMEQHIVTFAPLLAKLLLEPAGRRVMHLSGMLAHSKTRALANDARYVKSLRALYAKHRISRFSDALTRVGVHQHSA